MATIETERVTGYVERSGGMGYGFIVTDDKRKVFFNIRNVKGRRLPQMGEIVVADILLQPEHSGNYRALRVERIEVPKP